MRKLAWAAVGFGTAAFLAEYYLPSSGLPYIAAALACVSPAAFLLKGNARKRAFLLCLAAACGFLCWWVHYERHVAPAEALAGQTVTVTARVTDYPEAGDDRTVIEARILDGAPTEKAVLYLYYADPPELKPGDIITAQVRISSAVSRGGEKTHTYTARNENLRGYIQENAEITGHSALSWLYFPKTVCRAVRSLCDELFPADTAAFMKALLTGYTTDLRANTRQYENMRLSGVVHIVAISGTHIFLLCAFFQLLLGRSRRTSLLCIPMIVVFMLMAGCTPSVVRATVMQTLLLAAPVFGRENDSVTGASAAMLLLLACNPMAIGSVGLQMSFTCVAGLVLLFPQWGRWTSEHKLRRHPALAYVADSIACTVCATVFSQPIAAYYFGTVSLLSPLANLLTLFLVEICFCGGYAVCAVGAVLPGVGSALAGLLSWLARWCFAVYEFIAAIPFACVYTAGSGTVLWLFGCYAMAILWFWLRRRGVKFRATVPACVCVIGLCVLLLSGGASLRQSGAVLSVLDVGQGECVALVDETAAVIIDCGGSGEDNAGNVAADYLLTSGKTRVNLLVLSHLHEDHTNGVATLMARLPVDCLVLPAQADDGDGMLEEILAAAQEQQTDGVFLTEEAIAQLGDMELALLLPEADSDENERGIVTLAKIGGRLAIMMGDGGTEAELALLSRGLLTDVDVLVVGHHGSNTASSALFLQAVEAETAVISAGYNSYGIPTEQVLERLGQYCRQVLRTDEDGTITIEMEAEDMMDG